MRPIGCHEVIRVHTPQRHDVFIRPGVAHHTDTLHRQEHRERLPDVVVEAGTADFLDEHVIGKPQDVESQALTLELALRLLESAPGARTTMQSPLRWSEDASWKLDYNNVAQMSPEELARRRAEFDKQKEIARGNRAA